MGVLAVFGRVIVALLVAMAAGILLDMLIARRRFGVVPRQFSG